MVLEIEGGMRVDREGVQNDWHSDVNRFGPLDRVIPYVLYEVYVDSIEC